MNKENKIIYRVIEATADIDSDSTEAYATIQVSFKVKYKDLIKFGKLEAENKALEKDFNALISKRIK